MLASAAGQRTPNKSAIARPRRIISECRARSPGSGAARHIARKSRTLGWSTTEVTGCEGAGGQRRRGLRRGPSRLNAASCGPNAVAAHTNGPNERRWSLLLGDRRRRGPGGQSPFPAATHRSAAEAIARKEEADQPVDLPALDTVSRTAAARTFPIMRAVHKAWPSKNCRLLAWPLALGTLARVRWPVEHRPGAAHTVIIPRPGPTRSGQRPLLPGHTPGGLVSAV